MILSAELQKLEPIHPFINDIKIASPESEGRVHKRIEFFLERSLIFSKRKRIQQKFLML